MYMKSAFENRPSILRASRWSTRQGEAAEDASNLSLRNTRAQFDPEGMSQPFQNQIPTTHSHPVPSISSSLVARPRNHNNNHQQQQQQPAGRREAPFEPFLAHIYGPVSLAHQTRCSPEIVYKGLTQLQEQNALLVRQVQELKAQNQRQEDIWRSTLVAYEALHANSMQKQMLLVEQIRRLSAAAKGDSPAESRGTAEEGSEASTVREGELKTPKSMESQVVEGDGEAGRLDPSAATFVPSPTKKFTRRSSLSPKKQSSPRKPSSPQKPPSPRKSSPPRKPEDETIIDNEAIDAPIVEPDSEEEKIIEKATTVLDSLESNFAPPELTPSPKPPSLPHELVSYLSRTLTTPFRNVCPHSLVYNYACNVPGCSMARLCTAYNDETAADGCEDPLCTDLHIYRTCLEEVDGLACSWHKVQKHQKRREVHFRKRAHRDGCAREEWVQRMLVAELRMDHRDGGYRSWEHLVVGVEERRG